MTSVSGASAVSHCFTGWVFSKNGAHSGRSVWPRSNATATEGHALLRAFTAAVAGGP